MSIFDATSNIFLNRAGAERDYARLREVEAQLIYQPDIFGMQAELARTFIGALIEKRLDAIREGFMEILNLYAKQAQHYMEQQNRLVDAEIKSLDPLERAHYKARLGELDVQLAKIRIDANNIYREMIKVTAFIGGPMPFVSKNNSRALALPRGIAYE